MVILEKEKYSKVIEPLSKVKFNNLFARAVIEKYVSGTVYVDNPDEPKTFYVIHPYGISLLFGESNNLAFNASFKEYALNTTKIRINYEWMQAFSSDWHSVLNDLFRDSIVKSSDNIEAKKEIIELNTRVNFKFNHSKYLDFRKNSTIQSLKIVKTNKQIFQDMKGNVTPLNFWDNASDFENNGVGFSLFHNKNLASTAYSAFVIDDKLEIGIETLPEFRGMGFAQHTCSSIIDYCIANNYEPIWSCRLENIGSYKLAKKLGFEPTVNHPFYRLSK